MSSVSLNNLPKREADLFRVLCDHYEKQAWAKAFKTAEDILHTQPNNPETLAMKGLTMCSAPIRDGGDKEKGLQLIKEGLLKSGFKSMICLFFPIRSDPTHNPFTSIVLLLLKPIHNLCDKL